MNGEKKIQFEFAHKFERQKQVNENRERESERVIRTDKYS